MDTMTETEVNLQKRKRMLKKLGLGFLVLIALLTFFSRTIYNSLLPEVECSHPTRGTLKKDIGAEGTIRFKNTVKVAAAGDWKIIDVKAECNDNVKKGDVLAVIDYDAFSADLSQKEAELRDLQADLESCVNNSEIDLATYEKEISQAEKQLEDQERSFLQLKQLYEGGAEAYSGVKDAEIKLTEARDDLASRKEILELKKTGYEKTITQKKLAIDNKTLECKKTSGKIPEKGLIRAPENGTIRAVSIGNGTSVNKGQTMFEIGGRNEKPEVVWKMDKKKASLAGGGGLIKVEADSSEKAVCDGSITGSRYSPEDDQYEFTGELKGYERDGKLQNGQKVDITIKKESVDYEIVLPNNAVIKENDTEGYVFVLRERERALGSENYVEKVNVRIMDSDDTSTAVNARLEPNDSVVTYSTQVLQEGARVKPV